MTASRLTHVWVEVPFYSDSLSLLPPEVTTLLPEAGSADPIGNAGEAQAILAAATIRYNDALFKQLPNLRIVQRTGIGVDNVNLPDATANGIVVCNTPDGPTESTAEHTVALLLNLAKRVKQGDANVAAGKFGPRSGDVDRRGGQGAQVGADRAGTIGRRVAAYLPPRVRHASDGV